MQYPILPKKKDREINTFYLVEGKVRFWNGKTLLCKCKYQIDRCKNCSPEGYQAYLERQKRMKKRYRENNRDVLRDRKRRYYENNREAINKKARIHYENNLEVLRERHRRYRDKNREAEKERHRIYYEKNRDVLKTKYRKKCEYDCCRFSDNPSFAEFKNYYDENQRICRSAAKNQMYDITIDIHESQKIAKHYGFKQNLVLRQEQAVLHRINSTPIGKTLREKTFGHSFDSDPIATIFGKNKNVKHKQPDYCVLIDKFSIIIIEYDENSAHEKSIARLNEIKEMFELSSETSLCNVHVIRINGNDDNKSKRVCIRRQRKETEGIYTNTKRFYELSEHGEKVVIEVTKLLEKIYNHLRHLDIIDLGDLKSVEFVKDDSLKLYEIN